MLASRWRDVHDLNWRAREGLAESGLLRGPTLDVDGRPFQAGDRIMTLRNARRLGITNGTTGTVASVDIDARTLTVRTDHGAAVTLPTTYLDSRAIVHGYATTVHKAQGLTVDRAYLLADDRLTRETGYTGLSRGRDENRLYMVDAHELEQDHGHLIGRDPMGNLRHALERSTAQQLAVDHDLGMEIEIG
jgi:ATP-dependent exoDNAse (exonuclease V) alpha subunit